MRIWLLALLLIVLPLRGWVGTAMAFEQSAHPGSGGTPASVHAVMPTDCVHGHDGMQHEQMVMPTTHDAATSTAPDSTGSHDHGGCTACQICHSAALGTLPAVTLVSFAPGSRPPSAALVYTSAERILGDKPPIL